MLSILALGIIALAAIMRWLTRKDDEQYHMWQRFFSYGGLLLAWTYIYRHWGGA